MLRMLFRTAAGLCLCTALSLSTASVLGQTEKAPASEAGCSGHGTTINFFDSPQEAAKRATKDQKLVLVLHVSGNFEDPSLT